MLDISHFLKHGNLLGLSIGNPEISLFENDSKFVFEKTIFKKNTSIYRSKNEFYDIQYCVINNTIVTITIQTYNNETYLVKEGDLKKTIWSHIPLYDFLSIIESLNLQWEIALKWTENKFLCIKLDSEVYCFFDLELQCLLKICCDKWMSG